VPTEDAHTLFTEVREIQDRVHALREAGRNLRRGTGGKLRISALPSLALDAIPTAVARFLSSHENVKFDLQTVHHDDLLRKLHERETDIAIAYQVPPSAPITQRWIGEGELVVLYREQDMPDAPSCIELHRLQGQRFISLAASGPTGRIFTEELQRLNLELDEVVSARTFYIAGALVRHGVGMTVVDSFTAQACLAPGLAMRPLKPRITFDIHAMFLINRPLGALATEFLKTLKSVLDTP
jgi:DNA-binding transcriptional LysR family regulator